MFLLQTILFHFCPNFVATILSVQFYLVYGIQQFFHNYCQILKLLWLVGSYAFEENVQPQIIDFFTRNSVFELLFILGSFAVLFKWALTEMGYELQIGFKEENCEDE